MPQIDCRDRSDRRTAEGRTQAWRRDFSGESRDVAVDEIHTGWIVDASNGEWFVSQNNQTDWIEAVNLQGGEPRRLLYHLHVPRPSQHAVASPPWRLR